MEYRYDSCPDYVVFTVEGLFIGGEDINKIYAFIQEQIKNGTKKIIFDFEKVSYIGSVVISFLIKINDELIDASGKVVLCNVSPSVMEIFKITKMNLILSIFDSKEKAIQALA